MAAVFLVTLNPECEGVWSTLAEAVTDACTLGHVISSGELTISSAAHGRWQPLLAGAAGSGAEQLKVAPGVPATIVAAGADTRPNARPLTLSALTATLAAGDVLVMLQLATAESAGRFLLVGRAGLPRAVASLRLDHLLDFADALAADDAAADDAGDEATAWEHLRGLGYVE
jgi:hypothetical protein